MAARLMHLFAQLNGLGTTLVMATHDLHLIERIANARLLRLERGELVPPDRPVDPPAETFPDLPFLN